MAMEWCDRTEIVKLYLRGAIYEKSHWRRERPCHCGMLRWIAGYDSSQVFSVLTKVGPHVDDEGEWVADAHRAGHPGAVERVAGAHLHRALGRRQREVNRVRRVRPEQREGRFRWVLFFVRIYLQS